VLAVNESLLRWQVVRLGAIIPAPGKKLPEHERTARIFIYIARCFLLLQQPPGEMYTGQGRSAGGPRTPLPDDRGSAAGGGHTMCRSIP
jgi:hypothetical protein